MKIKIDDWYEIHNGFTIDIKPGYIPLIGPNGAGKTTLLHQLKQYAKSNDIEVYQYSNNINGQSNATAKYVWEGKMDIAATLVSSSEGEQVAINFGQACSEIGAIVRKCINNKKSLFILIDAVDSGASIDRCRDLIDLFEMIEDNEINPNDADIYIIVAVNQYELVKGIKNCIDPRTGKYHQFKDYEDYAKFICSYFG